MTEEPHRQGYRMPAEWEKHEATWLAWPKDPLTFPPGIIEKVEGTYAKIIGSLAKGERVDLLVDDSATEARVKRTMGSDVDLVVHRIRTADVWIRDYGPIFIKNSEVAATKWRFNAWGNKYEELLPDDKSGMDVAMSSGVRIFQPGIVLEGGSVDVNGLGTCLVTEQCLLNKNRNPGKSRAQIERYLRDYLGEEHTVWLKSGIVGDDTDGHVDDLARFTSEGTVLCMVEADETDENHDPLGENRRALAEALDQDARRFEVVEVPMPRKKVGGADRLPASYANFYIGNSVVLVPVFDDPNDSSALSTIADLFPNREVVGINCEALVYGFGGIHCITQQQPSLNA